MRPERSFNTQSFEAVSFGISESTRTQNNNNPEAAITSGEIILFSRVDEEKILKLRINHQKQIKPLNQSKPSPAAIGSHLIHNRIHRKILLIFIPVRFLRKWN